MLRKFLYRLVLLILGLSTTDAIAIDEPLIASSPPLHEEVLSVPGDPDNAPSLFGDNHLIVTLLKPDGPGPFPLAVMNHGANGLTMSPGEQPRERGGLVAFYFLSRGYAVALPMLRAYAGSNGRQIVKGCNQQELGLFNAQDLKHILAYFSSQDYIDSKRVVMAGQSFGGWNTLAFGTLKQPNVKVLLNFVGGAYTQSCHDTREALTQAAKFYGSNTTTPSLWFYGENDSILDISDWQPMFEQYVAAGGPGWLVNYGRFMQDSHQLLAYPEGLQIWVPRVDAFLVEAGLPGKNIHPEYMPMEFPPPSHFAAIDDIDAIPYINDKGREVFKKFLSQAAPKVFVITENGEAVSSSGGLDPLGRAMKSCQQHSKTCQVYAVDNSVVWKQAK